MDETRPLYGASMKKIVFFVAIGVMLVVIASNMSYQQQTLIPSLQLLLKDKPFLKLLSQLEIPYWGTTVSVETRGYYFFVEFLMRKGAHFFGYGILAVIFFTLYTKLVWRFPAVLAFFTILLIASLDEYRQSMIPGRTGIVSDVILNATGAITLLLIVKGIHLLKNIINKKTAEQR